VPACPDPDTERDCYTLHMGSPRTLPLFEERAQPQSWNERMAVGEYAVHYSSFDSDPGIPPSCTVFSTLAEAEAYATEQIAQRPTLRCRIYDHQGFVGQPIREFRGSGYKDKNDISPRFRRWAGSGLFFGGLILTLVDWAHDFSLSWPAMIGTRMLVPGLILLMTEAVILLAKRKSDHDNKRRMV
jgi:hypothetical protein